MSEYFEDLKQYQEEQRQQRAEKRETNKDIFEEMYNNDDSYLVEKRTDYHFSLYLNSERVDYFPTSGKAKNVTHNSKYFKTNKPEELKALFIQNQ